jgi:hypothetical protein
VDESSVEVSLSPVNGILTIKLVAANSNGIKKMAVWSRWGKVPIIRNYECLKVVEDSVAPYPTEWFPVVVDVTDCQSGKTSRLGPFNVDGSEALGFVEMEDTSKSPGPYKQM